MPVTETLGRRNCIPILYTRGTHYEVGYDVGRTFASLIHDYLKNSFMLNDEYIPAYETDAGRRAYDDTLECVRENFPHYVRELEGTADGAKVPFYKLFLLHMDNIITNACEMTGNIEATGCSSICVNNGEQEVLGHTEDAFNVALNNYYFVSAHIITEKPQGKWGVTEERFTSLCYAGHLPGYTMNYNHHGLVFSINTLSAAKLHPGKTPRHFLTRALLSAENFEQAQKILRDSGCGAGDGCSINLTFLNQEGDRLFHNAEMGPADYGNESQLNILTASPGEHLLHTNKYLRLEIQQIKGFVIDSAEARLDALKTFKPPKSKNDVIEMLGDQSGIKYRVFQDFGPDDVVKTIAVGIFDCKEKTLSLYADNPKSNEPLVVIPLVLKKTNKM
ncbi:PREDICTED: uncharacterized protein LOC108564492 [Nicrophorus vespilloides]|uniref:Uncharacterized protein LOC108564492 n=1 Tax=Nicrophorus vespilloides TaxID=110193 RepID=A0ABM1MWU6_NICVS|nr:PREDICTED: uncharacterized protein LOC108564492 [Nicrophorus vespilloides]